jgi:hypothetical protein
MRGEIDYGQKKSYTFLSTTFVTLHIKTVGPSNDIATADDDTSNFNLQGN